MRVHCHTYLDLLNEEWPKDLPAMPRVGEYIQSATMYGEFQLILEIVSVTWGKDCYSGEWFSKIELHDRKVFKRSIREFYEWYAPLVGKSVGNFI